MRLIDADALNKRLGEVVGPPWPDSELDEVNKCIMAAPTIDAVPTSNVRRTILDAAIRHFGARHQISKAIEEMAELIRALARYDDRDNIAEEMADVRILMDQLEMILHNREAVRMWELKKLKYVDELVHAADRIG